MYISRLKLYGFKSFLKKSEINFGRGVTCVVGPNGCGKTNIVDAIRWVVGEQKARILRADKSTDVIFNGTSKRKPLNIAEVSLTIHNVSGRIPIDYTDLEITRRIYRNGDSEYLLNRNICRLKDIRNLFIDTGMGADAYSIIELKMIENILSENPNERKNLFEEAAGVNKYRIQRKAALRKLEATEEDLVRVSDIITEVDSKVKTLRRQLRQYEKYQQLSQKLIDAEVLLAAVRINNLKKEKNPLEQQLKDQKNKLILISRELERFERELENRQAEHDNAEIKLNKKSEVYNHIRENRNKIQTDELVLKEQYQYKLSEFTRLNEEITATKSTIEQTKQRILQLHSEEKKYEKQLLNQQNDQDKYSKQQKILSEKYQQANSELEKLQDKKFITVKKYSEHQARQNALNENIDFIKKEIQELEKEKEKKSSLHTQRCNQMETETHQLQELEEELAELQNDRIIDREKLEILLEKQENSLAEKRRLNSEMDKLSNKIDFFSGLLESKEGFSPVLQQILKNRDQQDGIIGAFAEMITVPEKYLDATNLLLGDLKDLLIVENFDQLFLLMDKVGRNAESEIIITALEDLKPVPRETQINSENLIPFSSIIKVPKSLEKLMENIFANVYLCEDDQFENIVKNVDTQNLVLVTQSGKMYNQAGILFSKSAKKSDALLYGREEKLFKYEQEYDHVSLQNRAVEEELEQLSGDISYYRNSLKKNETARESAQNKIRQLEGKISNHQNDIQQTEARLRELKNKIIKETTALKNFIAKREKLKSENQQKSELDEVEKNISLLKNEVDNRKKRLDDFIKEVQNFRVELVKIKNKFDNMRNEKASLTKSLATLERRLDSKIKQKNEVRLKKQEMEALIEEKKLELEKIFQEEQMIKENLEKIRTEYNQLKDRVQESNKEIYKARHQKEVLTETINKLELENSELFSKQREIESVLYEKYNQKIQWDKISELPSLESAENNRVKLQRRLENVGTINMGVKTEYEEEAERLRFLSDQKKDLEEASATVRKAIREIDIVARKQYIDTFHKIRENFKNIFQIFFPGGSTDIKLIGDDDPLESKIEIFACPGGKKMLSLRMLSAGEKTLTAIALLFGIYQVKPSPFCILDEVDAPLDDANTRRFTNLLKTFSDNTQFIIVTHNKVTMNVADVLFGVTMGEMGVSQIVSVNLD